VTGALEKVNLPSSPTLYYNVLECNGGSVKNNAGGDTTLHSFAIPANSLNNIGAYAEFYYQLTLTGSGTNKVLKINYGGTLFSMGTIAGTGTFLVRIQIWRKDASNAVLAYNVLNPTSSQGSGATAAFAYTFSSNFTLTLIGNCVTANLIELWGWQAYLTTAF
jgi:hypothetical protein